MRIAKEIYLCDYKPIPEEILRFKLVFFAFFYNEEVASTNIPEDIIIIFCKIQKRAEFYFLSAGDSTFITGLPSSTMVQRSFRPYRNAKKECLKTYSVLSCSSPQYRSW